MSAELNQTLFVLLRKQFKLRLEKTSGEFAQTHQIKQVRRDIARVLTILAEQEGNA